jgi:hypothetical protein
MQVPEATVDVDDLSQSRKYQIGTAGKRPDVQTVAVSQRMNEPTDHHFRGRVLRLDRRHDAGAFTIGNRNDRSTKVRRNVDKNRLVAKCLGGAMVAQQQEFTQDFVWRQVEKGRR